MRRRVIRVSAAILLFAGAAAALLLANAPPQSVEAATHSSQARVTVNLRSFGAKGNGKTDDTRALQLAMRTVAAKGGGTIRVPAGTYRFGALTLPNKVAITGDGQSVSWLHGRLLVGSYSYLSNLKLGTNGAALRFVNGATATVFDHVAFVGGGAMTSGENQGVIRFSSGRRASFITFRSCTIGANSADGNGVSMVDNGWSGATYHDISFVGCHFAGSPRMTVEVIQRPANGHTITTGYRNIDFTNCVFEPAGSEAISYDSDAGNAGYSTVSGCTIKGAGRNSAYAWGQGVEFNGVINMRFESNTVYRCRDTMINHQGQAGIATNNVYSHNVFDSTVSFITQVPSASTPIITFLNVAASRFDDNVVKTDVGGPQVVLAGSTGNQFLNNQLTDIRAGSAAHQSIWLTASANNTFDNDRLTTSVGSGVVYICNNSDSNTFSNCTFVASGGLPIDASSNLKLTLEGNTYL